MSDLLFYDQIDRPGLASLRTYTDLGGYSMLRKALESDQQEIIDQLLASNVRGRGGAGFAMGRKASRRRLPRRAPPASSASA